VADRELGFFIPGRANPATMVERPDDNPYVEDPTTEFAPVAELSAEEAREQAAALRAAIDYHDHRYYVAADPLIADRTYDALLSRLEALEAAFALPTENSPTRRVGGEPLDELETVAHVAPMLSIDQGGDPEDVRAFDERVRRELGDAGLEDPAYACEPKFDGLSIELVYEDGELVRAATRGDGEAGDDVTANVRTIGAVPLRVPDAPPFLAVRGEIYIPLSGFGALNRERIEAGEDPFANPRNAAAGTLRQLDPAVVAERPLDVVVYDAMAAGESADAATVAGEAPDPDGPWPPSHHEERAWLAALGFPTPDGEWTDRVDDVEGAIAYRDALLAAREDLDYEVDGAVIKVDDRAACAELGRTSRHVRWAFAYKFPARTEETTLRDVVVQVGRTGRLTPVALLDPVDVGGVTVSRASLHNPEQVADLGVGVGDRVRVQRAGDVIPQVAEVVESDGEGHYAFPDACPTCGEPVEREGPMAFCTGGWACPAQLRRRVEHYADVLDIEGLGGELVDQLVEEGLVERPADLYELDAEELAALDGWGETSATNVLAEVDAAREVPLGAFLAAVSIPEVGPAVARNVARELGDVEAVLAADEDALRAAPEVGPEVARRVVSFFENPANRAAVDDLLDHVDVRPADAGADAGDELAGLTVVFTGSLSVPRSDAQELVEAHGASATSSVSGNTDYLVVGDNPGRSKREAADEHGVPTVDEAEFGELLADRGVAWPPE